MFDVVNSIMREGLICADCLGRQFAEYSSNLTNKQRGQAIRVVTAMLNNTPVNAQDWEAAEEGCWDCGGLFNHLDSWVDRCLEQLLSLIHISEPTRLGMISYAVFC